MLRRSGCRKISINLVLTVYDYKHKHRTLTPPEKLLTSFNFSNTTGDRAGTTFYTKTINNMSSLCSAILQLKIMKAELLSLRVC